MRLLAPVALSAVLVSLTAASLPAVPPLRLNSAGYLEKPGLNVMLASDYYPDGHQGGLVILQNGVRVASNGDLRLDRTPGQWSPVPKTGARTLDPERSRISVAMAFPDESKNRTGFNPIDYPDLQLEYTVHVEPDPASESFRVWVDLSRPLPEAYVGDVGFLLELFPGRLFGKGYQLDQHSGVFAPQMLGPGHLSPKGEYTVEALARGRRLTVAPEEPAQRLTIEAERGGELELIDGRGPHNNGWFLVRSLVPAGATTRAVEWTITANALPGFIAPPVLQLSQLGFHPEEAKQLVIELDPRDDRRPAAEILLVSPEGEKKVVAHPTPRPWGRFLRSDYLAVDFSRVKEPGLYQIRYGEQLSHVFRIDPALYQRGVWQPTLEYFLPIQMCHVQVRDRYQIWHGYCHLDDARMAPVNLNHFDGYVQGPSTLTRFAPGEQVPGLNHGGWHDAGDHDLRVESQAETLHGLALAYETFGVTFDQTFVDFDRRQVELHRPDGVPDALQQLEHGLRSVVGGYHALGRLYRGIQDPTLHQYVLLGDPANATDNRPFVPGALTPEPKVGQLGSPDDRWVFTEENPERELHTAAALAAAARVLRSSRPELAQATLTVAKELWTRTPQRGGPARLFAATELSLTTKEAPYGDYLRTHLDDLETHFRQIGWAVGRAALALGDDDYLKKVRALVASAAADTRREAEETPYGMPYRPDIWGAGWTIQNFGMKEAFLHRSFPDLVSDEYFLKAFHFILGRHPGSNNASFVSGVGSRSTLVAYGFNRADTTYLPGGIVSGTALIRPDFPELLEWPYLWQQTEYVLGGGTTDYLLLALAVSEKFPAARAH